MWSSISFGIFGLSAGYLVDTLSEGKFEKDYTCIFYIMLVAMILDIAVSATLKKVHLFFKYTLLQLNVKLGSVQKSDIFSQKNTKLPDNGEISIITEKSRMFRDRATNTMGTTYHV